MGGCWSIVLVRGTSSSGRDGDESSSTAKVIYMNASVHEYPVPLNVSEVLEADQSSSLFICHSDSLYYDSYIPALDSEDPLEANQIYFVLPRSKLQRRLSATDMAALAVRASLALQKINTKASSSSSSLKKEKGNKKENKGSGYRNYKTARISPVIEMNNNKYANSSAEGDGGDLSMNGLTIGGGGSLAYKGQKMMSCSGRGGGSSSVRKLRRYTSRKAKLATRSFRLRLSTIHEGSVL
ncbi:hypothetical protein D8674_031236 [Pyrus ussuriensis x Pyrus communis]|uniref:Uncharacterized protein n=1 Tax=Pyrus ussuriensis x Pyrus communis TaxID=2448454 RepID=A0A5N5EYB0_9ROSA|nr:hypothetical protein D8674_031236 [Pyrus ussuriensis x Pyrus communis]